MIVPPGDPVQLAEPVKAKVNVYDKNGKLIPGGKATIPEGYWVMPDDGEDEHGKLLPPPKKP